MYIPSAATGGLDTFHPLLISDVERIAVRGHLVLDCIEDVEQKERIPKNSVMAEAAKRKQGLPPSADCRAAGPPKEHNAEERQKIQAAPIAERLVPLIQDTSLPNSDSGSMIALTAEAARPPAQ